MMKITTKSQIGFGQARTIAAMLLQMKITTSCPNNAKPNVSSIPFSVASYKLKISLAFFQFFFKIGLLTDVSPFEGSPEK